RDDRRRQRRPERDHVRGHVARIGQKRQGSGEQARSQLDAEERGGEHERRSQPPPVPCAGVPGRRAMTGGMAESMRMSRTHGDRPLPYSCIYAHMLTNPGGEGQSCCGLPVSVLPMSVLSVSALCRSYAVTARRHRRIRRPLGVAPKPAASNAAECAELWTGSPSMRVMVRGPTASDRTAATRADAASGTASLRWSRTRTVRPPPSTYTTHTPWTRTPSAPAFRPGRCPGVAGHGSAAPYGLAGSVAARTRTTGWSAPEGHRVSSAESSKDRRRSIVLPVANWAAPRPSTK